MELESVLNLLTIAVVFYILIIIAIMIVWFRNNREVFRKRTKDFDKSVVFEKLESNQIEKEIERGLDESDEQLPPERPKSIKSLATIRSSKSVESPVEKKPKTESQEMFETLKLNSVSPEEPESPKLILKSPKESVIISQESTPTAIAPIVPIVPIVSPPTPPTPAPAGPGLSGLSGKVLVKDIDFTLESI